MRYIWLAILSLWSIQGWALEFPLPNTDVGVVGKVEQTRIQWKDNFCRVARRFDVGVAALKRANPRFSDSELPLLYTLSVPQQFILPPGQRQGIVINTAQMRLFYFDKQNKTLLTFPVGVGKQGRQTPTGTMNIIEKIKHPAWHPPVSIIREFAEKGIELPKVIPHGPQDPLGDYALRLSRRLYLIHGTNKPATIGTAASSGCVRLFPEDIAKLFEQIPVGTAVRIIHQPLLLGWMGQQLFLAAYPPLPATKAAKQQAMHYLEKSIQQQVRTRNDQISIDWAKVDRIFNAREGRAQLISLKTPLD